MPGRFWLCILLSASLLALGTRSFAAEDDEEEEEPQLLPGLVARYSTADAECVRRDDALQFVWRDRSPDERLRPGDFSARWEGQLLVVSPGKHRFYVYAVGEVSLTIDGRRIVAGSSQMAQWFDSATVDLEFGHHKIAFSFRKTSDQSRLGLYWSGPQFDLEPMPGRLLFHEPSNDPDDRFERGAELWRALRCGNCHPQVAGPAGLPSPSLVDLSGNLSRAWLVGWLRAGSGLTDRDLEVSDLGVGARRMPHFGLDESDANTVADYLLSAEPSERSEPNEAGGDAVRGRRLFLTLGCLACHQVGDLGASGLFGGGDLAHVAEKRPADFFARWLADPAKINPANRMPVFRLSNEERSDMSAWLATLGTPAAPENERSGVIDSGRGRAVIESLRCRACHAVPGLKSAPASVAIRESWENRPTCLDRPDVKNGGRPGYRLSPVQREALTAYLTAVQRGSPASDDGRFVLKERNCLGCHARDGGEGIAAKFAVLVERQPELAPLLPTLAPPSLTAVGDKLHDEALANAVSLRNPPLRPWLAVRMPRFNLSAEELAALTGHLATIDRIPDRPSPEAKNDPRPPGDKSLAAAGGRLVTSAGFGCTSCHNIGRWEPTNVALAARGTDLSLVGKRIRRAWFDRWVRNPARIVPRMEMPAIQIPLRGALGDKLDEQLAAVWHVLNAPGFNPPAVGPVRVARHSGDDGPPVVITDVVETSKRAIVRPVMIGLKNRHNVLFDLGANCLAAWWLGDTAWQQTRGKSWLWEPAGTNLLSDAEPPGPELELLAGERAIASVPIAGSSLADLDWFSNEADSVAFGYRLKFADQTGTIIVRVVERFEPLDGEAKGLRRRWEIAGVPAGTRVRLRLPADGPNFRLRVDSPLASEREADGSRWLFLPTVEGAASVYEVSYLARVDVTPAAAAPFSQAETLVRLSVVPGYDATRLPLSRSEMPTGLSWREDGTLVFCSLKGGIWLAKDTDADGLEDRLQLVADGLAAPYGLACRDDAIDVAAKFGVVRLSRFDTDGRARRADVVASGWGYTADYHDWTIGLPRDGQGNYYVGLPCQQDNRPTEEAHLRGTVVKLLPRAPTPESPRLFDLDLVAAGVRFPMGLAIDRNGEAFFTDNQGNYNPFNELNHVRRGARYGFINKLEAKPGFQPPFDEPAVAVPHPWTRSVNGICFLYTPHAALERSGRPVFGPFEGHLVGCEFDTRRLIRMSLEKIGETYQGAAYPFSVEPASGEPTFEGPVVADVSPKGDIYVGNLRDSGWGGGQNTGSIVRLRPNGTLPVGIAEVHALADGFAIDFTAPVDGARAANRDNYSVTSYRRVTTPAYGGPDVDRESESIADIAPSSDSRRVVLRLRRMRAGFVYELRLKNLAGSDQPFFPAEAHYTLKIVPH
ncbi:MAG TPA: c-type cytochrome [Pirellulales bacterium]|nr:c-type cytochrome [Pirellulales bacterium]